MPPERQPAANFEAKNRVGYVLGSNTFAIDAMRAFKPKCTTCFEHNLKLLGKLPRHKDVQPCSLTQRVMQSLKPLYFYSIIGLAAYVYMSS